MKPDFDSHNPYKVLGVRRNASEKTIKKAFRELSMKYHPDTGGDCGDPEIFKAITDAYKLLTNPNEKSFFDKHGRRPENNLSKRSASTQHLAELYRTWLMETIQRGVKLQPGWDPPLNEFINQDVVGKLKKEVERILKEQEKKLTECLEAIKVAKKILDRCVKGLLVDVTEAQISQMENHAKKHQNDIEIFKECLESLTDGSWIYMFESDEPDQPTAGNITMTMRGITTGSA